MDYGTLKVGLAMADPLRLFAQSVGTFTPERAFHKITTVDKEEGIDIIVLGWPTGLGEDEELFRVITDFESRVAKEFNLAKIVRVDESYSSREAEAILVESGVKKSKRREKGRVDSAAAAVILQRYLDGLL